MIRSMLIWSCSNLIKKYKDDLIRKFLTPFHKIPNEKEKRVFIQISNPHEYSLILEIDKDNLVPVRYSYSCSFTGYLTRDRLSFSF